MPRQTVKPSEERYRRWQLVCIGPAYQAERFSRCQPREQAETRRIPATMSRRYSYPYCVLIRTCSMLCPGLAEFPTLQSACLTVALNRSQVAQFLEACARCGYSGAASPCAEVIHSPHVTRLSAFVEPTMISNSIGPFSVLYRLSSSFQQLYHANHILRFLSMIDA